VRMSAACGESFSTVGRGAHMDSSKLAVTSRQKAGGPMGSLTFSLFAVKSIVL
jgi:hypothetical protein